MELYVSIFLEMTRGTIIRRGIGDNEKNSRDFSKRGENFTIYF